MIIKKNNSTYGGGVRWMEVEVVVLVVAALAIKMVMMMVMKVEVVVVGDRDSGCGGHECDGGGNWRQR